MSDDQPVLGRSHPTAHLPIATARSTEQLDLVQRSSIVRFLSGTLAPEALADEIADEVAAFREALRTTASGNIIVSNGPQFLVTKTGARRLLEAVAREKLPFDAANYIADCIIMNLDFDFEDDAARDAAHFIEDDTERFIAEDDNWRPTREATLAALALLD